MAGDWQTTSERLIYENDFVKKEEAEDVKPGAISLGIRKRKFEGQEEEEEAGETVVRKGWGSTIRTYPGGGGDEEDLDALLKNTKRVLKEDEGPQTLGSVRSSQPEQTVGHAKTKEGQHGPHLPAVKREDSAGSSGVPDAILNQTAIVEAPPETLRPEEDTPDFGVVFKKRKAKPIQQK